MVRRARGFAVVSVLVFAILACSRDDAGPAASSALACPTAPPATGSNGATCVDGLGCEYGDDPACADRYECHGGRWSIAPHGFCAKDTPGCPTSFAAAQTLTACPLDAACAYAEGRCACAPCENDAIDDADSAWTCEAWPAPPLCPWPRPAFDMSCPSSLEGDVCDYGGDCCDPLFGTAPAMLCFDGVWRAAARESCSCPSRCASDAGRSD